MLQLYGSRRRFSRLIIQDFPQSHLPGWNCRAAVQGSCDSARCGVLRPAAVDALMADLELPGGPTSLLSAQGYGRGAALSPPAIAGASSIITAQQQLQQPGWRN